VVVICGRYEGVDERVAELLATDEVSVGDYVLSGGEPAAAVVVDAVVRLLPGALGSETSAVNESFSSDGGPLDFPHYTRPPEFRGLRVPDVLLGGNHAEIARWRRHAALRKTAAPTCSRAPRSRTRSARGWKRRIFDFRFLICDWKGRAARRAGSKLKDQKSQI
jgi:tRNA (guanine-N1)-methyltransferase